MTDTSNDDGDDRRLWQRLTVRRPPETGVIGPDALLLAEALEGRLDDADREALEARMAASPAVLEALLAARALPADFVGTPPMRVVLDAKALLRQPPRPAARPRRAAWLSGAFEWAAVAACLVVFAAAGVEIGSGTPQPPLPDPAATVADLVTASARPLDGTGDEAFQFALALAADATNGETS